MSDPEVGRFALRTFKVREGHLSSVVATHSGQHWEGGVCRARCVIFDDYSFFDESMARITRAAIARHRDPSKYREGLSKFLKHDAPHEDCRCGVYGSLNLENLRRQYHESLNLVAVIAAEGETIIGTRGLRTEFARVVAYWTPWGAFSVRW